MADLPVRPPADVSRSFVFTRTRMNGTPPPTSAELLTILPGALRWDGAVLLYCYVYVREEKWPMEPEISSD